MAGYQVSVDTAYIVCARIPYGWKLLQVKKTFTVLPVQIFIHKGPGHLTCKCFLVKLLELRNLQKFQHGLDVCTYICIISRFLQIHMLYPLS